MVTYYKIYAKKIGTDIWQDAYTSLDKENVMATFEDFKSIKSFEGFDLKVLKEEHSEIEIAIRTVVKSKYDKKNKSYGDPNDKFFKPK